MVGQSIQSIGAELNSIFGCTNSRLRKELEAQTFRSCESDSPYEEISMNLGRFRGKQGLRFLSICSWFLDPYLAFLVRDYVKKKLDWCPDANKLAVQDLLLSKHLCLELLISCMSNQDWYGNFKPMLERLEPLLHFRRKHGPKSRRPLRKRGHRTNGKLISSNLYWLREYANDWTSKRDQLLIEERRSKKKATTESLCIYSNWWWADSG